MVQANGVLARRATSWHPALYAQDLEGSLPRTLYGEKGAALGAAGSRSGSRWEPLGAAGRWDARVGRSLQIWTLQGRRWPEIAGGKAPERRGAVRPHAGQRAGLGPGGLGATPLGRVGGCPRTGGGARRLERGAELGAAGFFSTCPPHHSALTRQ